MWIFNMRVIIRIIYTSEKASTLSRYSCEVYSQEKYFNRAFPKSACLKTCVNLSNKINVIQKTINKRAFGM